MSTATKERRSTLPDYLKASPLKDVPAPAKSRIILPGKATIEVPQAPAISLERVTTVRTEREVKRLLASRGRDAFAEASYIDAPVMDRAMDRLEREWFRVYMGRELRRRKRHWDGPGTAYAGVEPLAWLRQGSPAAIATTAVIQSFIQFSVVTGDVGPFSPSYWKELGDSIRLTAFGVASCTATPTGTFTWTQGTTWANPITGTLAASPAITFGSGVQNCMWYAHGISRVILTGQSGAVITMVKTEDNFAATATWVDRIFANATPPSNVTMNFTLSQYVDFCFTWSASSASNTAQMLEYLLESVR